MTITGVRTAEAAVDRPPPGPRKRKGSRGTLRGWMFIGPVVVGTLLFNILPILPTLALSFADWNGLNTPTFIGLDNYARMVDGGDPLLARSLLNTIIYTVGYVPLGMLVGLGLAVLVNNKLRGMAVFRALIFLPYVTSLVAVGIIARWVFSDQYGVINSLLAGIGITGPHWLGETAPAMTAVIITAVWANMGFNMVIILAGLQNVPEVLMDAAKLDGANTLARFRNVTVPFLTPTLFLLVILQTIGSFQVFALIFTMTSGGPGQGTYVFIYHLWYEAFQLRNMGYGAAMAVVLFLVMALITWGQMRLSKRWVFYQ